MNHSTNHLAFNEGISFTLFLFIIEVEIPFYEVVDTGFRKALMKSQLILDMTEECFKRIRRPRQPGVVDVLEEVRDCSFEVYIGLSLASIPGSASAALFFDYHSLDETSFI